MSPDCPPTNTPTVQHKVHQTNSHSNTSTPNNKVSAMKVNKGKNKNFFSGTMRPYHTFFTAIFSTLQLESKLASPKINRTSVSKRQEKSPVLNVRKNNSINAALKANQNAAAAAHHHVNENVLSTATSKLHKNVIHSGSPTPPIKSKDTTALVAAQQTMNHSYSPTPDDMSTVSSDDDSDHINVEKLRTIRSKAAQR